MPCHAPIPEFLPPKTGLFKTLLVLPYSVIVLLSLSLPKKNYDLGRWIDVLAHMVITQCCSKELGKHSSIVAAHLGSQHLAWGSRMPVKRTIGGQCQMWRGICPPSESAGVWISSAPSFFSFSAPRQSPPLQGRTKQHESVMDKMASKSKRAMIGAAVVRHLRSPR